VNGADFYFLGFLTATLVFTVGLVLCGVLR
jgi:hypothetical protein